MVFVSVLLKNAHMEAERIKASRSEYIYCKKTQPELFGFENSKEKIFFDDIYKGELYSALYLAMATTKNEISKWIKENTTLKYIQYEPEARAVLVESNTSIFLCFRGTQMSDTIDITTDFTLISEKQFGGKIHKGFYERAKSVDILSIYLLAKSKGKRLIFCGHSLGGAVATLSTLIVLFSDYYNEKDVDVYCIAFGNPLCLSKEVVDNCIKKHFQRHFISFVNEGDIIPISSNRKAAIKIIAEIYQKIPLLSIVSSYVKSFVDLSDSNYLLFAELLKNSPSLVMDNVIDNKIAIYVPLGTYYFCNYHMCNSNPYDNYIVLWEEKYEKRILSCLEYETNKESLNRHFIVNYFYNIFQFIERDLPPRESMNLYTRLKLPINCSVQLIKQSYRREILIWHPDKAYNHPGINIEDFANAFIYISESFKVLDNEERRSKYLESLYNHKPIEVDKEITKEQATALFTDLFKRFMNYPLVNRGIDPDSLIPSSAPTITVVPARASATAASNAASKAGSSAASKAATSTSSSSSSGIAASDTTIITKSLTTGFNSLAVVGGSMLLGGTICGLLEAWNQLTVYHKKKYMSGVIKTMTRGYIDRLLVNILIHHNVNQLLLENGEDIKLLLTNGSTKVNSKDFTILLNITKNNPIEAEVSEDMIELAKKDVYNSFELMTMEEATKIIDDILRRYKLLDNQIIEEAVYQTIDTTLAGAKDTGIKAGLGMALKTIAKSSGRIAAPFAVASVLVDLGKEYMIYKDKQRKKKQNNKLTSADTILLRKEFIQNMRQQAMTSGSAAGGALLICLCLPASAGLAICTSAALASGFAFYYIGNKIHKKLYGKINEKNKQIADEIERLEVGARILFEELDTNHHGYLNREQTKTLLSSLFKASNIDKDESDDILEYTIDKLVDKDGQLDWYTFWDWISYNEFQKLNIEKNESTTPTTPQVESEVEKDGKEKQTIKKMNELSVEERRIHTMCTLLDVDGIRLFLNDWLLPMPSNMRKEELVWFCVENVVKQRKHLAIEYDDLTCLSVEQLRRMIADIGFPYLYSNSSEELAQVLQYGLQQRAKE